MFDASWKVVVVAINLDGKVWDNSCVEGRVSGGVVPVLLWREAGRIRFRTCAADSD